MKKTIKTKKSIQKIGWAVLGKKSKVVGFREKIREVFGKEHIIYAQLPGGGCDCSWTEDAFWVFKTKKEANSHVEYPPHGYTRATTRVVKITISY